MNNIGKIFQPKMALLIYQGEGRKRETYVESFELDSNGLPINEHPLTVLEAENLAKALIVSKGESNVFGFKGIIPANVLKIDPNPNGEIVWYTKASQRNLYFKEILEIPNGKASVPALLWIANGNGLKIYALKGNKRPCESSNLFHAPFFNIYSDGKVCLGTIEIEMKRNASLLEFIQYWERCFFDSYFSHLMGSHNPINGNCVSIWKDLVNTSKPFPNDLLIKTNFTLKNKLK